MAAVSEVEAGIRDFVRNDIAYLRRPATVSGAEPALDQSAEATVNNVNSLIQRVAGTSLSEIENLIGELEALRDRMVTNVIGAPLVAKARSVDAILERAKLTRPA